MVGRGKRGADSGICSWVHRGAPPPLISGAAGDVLENFPCEKGNVPRHASARCPFPFWGPLTVRFDARSCLILWLPVGDDGYVFQDRRG